MVDLDDTAAAIGSGDVLCLGTPRLLAWFEAETCALSQAMLSHEQTTVGTGVEIEHLAASPVGGVVEISAAVRDFADRWIDFDVTALDPGSGRLLARGTITRTIVSREDFLARLDLTT